MYFLLNVLLIELSKSFKGYIFNCFSDSSIPVLFVESTQALGTYPASLVLIVSSLILLRSEYTACAILCF